MRNEGPKETADVHSSTSVCVCLIYDMENELERRERQHGGDRYAINGKVRTYKGRLTVDKSEQNREMSNAQNTRGTQSEKEGINGNGMHKYTPNTRTQSQPNMYTHTTQIQTRTHTYTHTLMIEETEKEGARAHTCGTPASKMQKHDAYWRPILSRTEGDRRTHEREGG